MIKYCCYLFFISGLYACNSKSDKEEVLPTGMVLIPSGTFEMGGKSEQAARDEYPRRNVEVSAFYMDVQEVSNRQFLAFVLATGYITVAERNIDWQEMKL
ncbi:MAG: sulfatase modifying factor 1, partial [Cyclobacteriaceae bacterium]